MEMFFICLRHPIRRNVSTEILYGGWDRLTDRETITCFANAHQGKLSIMKNGEY